MESSRKSLVQALNKLLSFFPWLLLAMLAVFNLAYFGLKTTQVIAAKPQRNQELAKNFIAQHIPPGSKVIGEPMYYYIVLGADSDYQLMDWYDDLDERERKQREIYQYEFFIVTDHQLKRNKEAVDYYFSKASLVPVGRFELPHSSAYKLISGLRIGHQKLISTVDQDGYNCTIYRRE